MTSRKSETQLKRALIESENRSRRIIKATPDASEERFRTLNNLISEMIDLKDMESIYEYISTSIHKYYSGSIVIFVSIDEQNNFGSLENIAGLDHGILSKIIKILGFNPKGYKFDLTPAHLLDYKTGALIEYKSLTEFNGLKHNIAVIIEKILDINKIYTIGINKNNNTLATILILTLKDRIIEDHSFLQTFVRQAAVIVQKMIAETALVRSEKHIRLLLDSTAEGIFGINTDGNCTFCNKAGLKILGYSDINMLIGRNMYKLIYDKKSEGLSKVFSTSGIYQSFREGREIHNEDDILFTAEGKSFPAEVWSYPIIDNDIIKGAVVTFVDISERKIAREKMIQLNMRLRELNATKNKLFSIIAHDLRSPLSSILSFSGMVRDNIRNYDLNQIEEHLRMINSSSEHTLLLLDNLLIWARTQTNQIEFRPEILKLQPVIQEILEVLKSAAIIKKINLSCSSPEATSCYADINMLRTILRNLIQNAIKFTKPGGRVKVYSAIEGDFVSVTVADNGTGMTEEVRKNLFILDPKFTSNGTAGEKGSGLGLILCREFIEKHGGKIVIESKLNHGSKCIFHLPVRSFQ